MCYAIPGIITNIDNESATVDYGGVTKAVSISLVDNVRVGDYILVHAGFAIEKLNKQSAEASLETIRKQIANGK